MSPSKTNSLSDYDLVLKLEYFYGYSHIFESFFPLEFPFFFFYIFFPSAPTPTSSTKAEVRFPL